MSSSAIWRTPLAAVRRRRLLGDPEAERGVDEQVEVDEPETDRHGEHQPEDAADARVAPAGGDRQLEADPLERRYGHRELDQRAREDADRVRVELLVAAEQGPERDQAGDDDDVPDQRRERRDREVVIGVEHADQQAVEAEQYDDREQDAAEADRQ